MRRGAELTKNVLADAGEGGPSLVLGANTAGEDLGKGIADAAPDEVLLLLLGPRPHLRRRRLHLLGVLEADRSAPGEDPLLLVQVTLDPRRLVAGSLTTPNLVALLKPSGGRGRAELSDEEGEVGLLGIHEW